MALAGFTSELNAGPWQPLFNGRDLSGWKEINGTAPFSVVDGAIAGVAKIGTPNSFLAYDEQLGDFILEFDVKQDVGPTNSGVQIRSLSTPDFREGRVHGYQIELDPSDRSWTGGIYDEARRGWLYPLTLNPAAQKLYHYGEWNRIRVEAIGPTLRTWVNGAPAAHVVDDLTLKGLLALQVHTIGKREEDAGRRILWRDLRVQTTNLAPSPGDDVFIRNFIPNNLSAAEQAQGWRLLWDGKTTEGWRAVAADSFPATGWKIENGELIVSGSADGRSHGGDIMTTGTYAAFEFQADVKLTPGANSGIKYFVTDRDHSSQGAALGLEYQLLDDARHPDAKAGRNGNRRLSSLYDLIPAEPVSRRLGINPEIGEWWHVRIVARRDGTVEHWLNGFKVLEYRRGSPEFRALVKESKYAGHAGFGEAPAGHIVLQDHGHEVRFRSIKIRELP